MLTNLFQLGKFTLNCGKESFFKLECDALTDHDWNCVATMARVLVPQFSAVTGVPRGGLKLAERLEPFITFGHGPHLIVDDVLTTGGSMERLRKDLLCGVGSVKSERDGQRVAGEPEPNIVGLVLFARGQCPWWVRAIFRLPEELWVNPLTRNTRGRSECLDPLD